MSRLRRLVLSDRYFFVTCKVLPARERLSEAEFALLAGSVQSRRTQHHFLLTAWVFLPDHWHAIIMPPYPSTISVVMESIKVSATRHINKLRGGWLWARSSRAQAKATRITVTRPAVLAKLRIKSARGRVMLPLSRSS